MAFEIIMPQFGLTMEEGTVSRWAVKEGDSVKKGDILLEVTTDKLSNEILSEYEGTVLKIVAREGEDYPVKAVLAYIGDAGEKLSDAAPVTEKAEPAQPAAVSAEKNSLIVIGGGPGGYVAAIRAAQLGAKVVLVEKDAVGGTCLNRGCMPTKALLHSSEVYEQATGSAGIGIVAGDVTVDWDKVQAFRASVVERLTGGVRALMKANKIELIQGEASFIASKTIKVGTQTLSADKIIIASGGKTKMPPIPGAELPACIDSTQCLALDHIPESMVIVGGGVIGVELGSVYARFGTKVTVLEMMPRILPLMDGELTQIITEKLRKTMDVRTGARVNAIEADGERAIVHVLTENGEESIPAEKVLLCVGRDVDCSALNLDKAGIEMKNGFINVNSCLETTANGVYAVGDCTGKLMLAHAAMAMGEIAAENAMGAQRSFNAELCPSCAYVGPEFAGVGLTEEQAKERGLKYKTGLFPTAANGKSLVLGCTDGMVKVLVGEKYGEILGVHILAPNATELIEQAVLAISLEATVDELSSMVYAHPSVSEAIHEAVLAADKRAIHIPNKK